MNSRHLKRSFTLKKYVLVICLLSLILQYALATEEKPSEVAINLRHPYNIAKDESYAKRTHYVVSLLELAARKSGRKINLQKVPISTVTANRNIRKLEAGSYDISWIHTDGERETALLPVRIPLFKGLIGWRIMFIRKENADIFSEVENLTQLKQLTAGLGHDWPDAQIFKYNDLKFTTSSSRDSLVHMLIGKRIDYFPRGVVEIWDEYKQINHPDIAVDTHIALVYPSAYYFFFRKGDIHLASLIETGLNNAIADGSFDQLFYQHYGDDIESSQIENRKIFYIQNRALPPSLNMHRKELWYSAEDKVTSKKDPRD